MSDDSQFGFSALPTRISLIFDKYDDENQFFTIPLFQREYSWSKNEIHKLLNQLLASDKNGHFVGTIFTAKQGAFEEVIDGQQRLTTFSLLILALCVHIKSNSSDDYKDLRKLVDERLQNYLFFKSNKIRTPQFTTANNEAVMLRLTPGAQNHNKEDYIILLNNHLQLNVNVEQSLLARHSIRKMNKSFILIQQWLIENVTNVDDLDSFIEKVIQTRLVLLRANSSNLATDLFDGLNNTGLQLSVSDIIKNKVLQSYTNSSLFSTIKITEAYKLWVKFIENIDLKYQSQYLKHLNYTLQFSILDNVNLTQTVTEKELPSIYENILQQAQSVKRKDDVIRKLSEHSNIYKVLLNPEPNWTDSNDVYTRILFELDLIEATPVLGLMLYLSDRNMDENEKIKVAKLCCKIFARQHITSQPKVGTIDNVIIKVINKLAKDTGVLTYDTVKDYLLNCDKHFNLSSKIYSSDIELERALKGPIYENNSIITRYLLIKLASTLVVTATVVTDPFSELNRYEMTIRQGRRDRKLYTIEHVLPQNENLNDYWKNALNECNSTLDVDTLHETYKHKLGNLTLTADNSALSDSDFITKQTLTSKTIAGTSYDIGYKNGDPLNDLKDKDGISLANAKTWNTDRIEQRTATMVEKLMSLLSLTTD